jgi:Calcineurin-like phosphoesterase
MRRPICFKAVCVLALIFAGFIGAGSAQAEPWRFGVMADTQWTAPTDPARQNPNGVAVSIINQINQEFIKSGVRFVIQVGDLTEKGNDADIHVRALAAAPLYLSGIGFFPMRGNHELYAKPEGVNKYGMTAFRENFPQTVGKGSDVFGAANFNSPTSVSTDLDGMSYSFDYGEPGNNGRFVIIDAWVTPSKRVPHENGYTYGYSVSDQQAWISSRLDRNTRGTMHAFVFSHQNLIGAYHQDSLFTGYTNANPAWQNAFFASLQENGVKYFISGHDHIHQRSIITSPDGASKVEQLICAPNSSKFYTPKPSTDPKWYGQKARETPVSQEMCAIGYYIFTVDGPRVTVDYYSDDHGKWQSDNGYPNGPGLPDTGITPLFKFIKKETWGYSLNGK